MRELHMRMLESRLAQAVEIGAMSNLEAGSYRMRASMEIDWVLIREIILMVIQIILMFLAKPKKEAEDT